MDVNTFPTICSAEAGKHVYIASASDTTPLRLLPARKNILLLTLIATFRIRNRLSNKYNVSKWVRAFALDLWLSVPFVQKGNGERTQNVRAKEIWKRTASPLCFRSARGAQASSASNVAKAAFIGSWAILGFSKHLDWNNFIPHARTGLKLHIWFLKLRVKKL